jgi:hypothetical protein
LGVGSVTMRKDDEEERDQGEREEGDKNNLKNLFLVCTVKSQKSLFTVPTRKNSYFAYSAGD